MHSHPSIVSLDLISGRGIPERSCRIKYIKPIIILSDRLAGYINRFIDCSRKQVPDAIRVSHKHIICDRFQMPLLVWAAENIYVV